MAKVVDALAPTINSEVQRYKGPKPLLRTQAKQLAVNAVKSYDPTSKAKLNSWVVTQLQPLSRYGREAGSSVHVSELAYRQSAEIARLSEELYDDLGAEPSDQQLADAAGISAARVKALRDMNRPVLSESAFMATDSPEAIEPAVAVTGTDPTLLTAREMVYEGLDPRDKMIYDLKTGSNGKEQLDNQSIAKRLGVTPALISQRSAMISQMILETQQRV
jgi:DNA-directed RNA polymerase specialized sigma subunit